MRNVFAFAILVVAVLGAPSAWAQTKTIGNPDYIHLKKDGDVWWLVDHTGKRFVTTGMNHVDEGKILFNEVNADWLTERFGTDLKGSWGGLNPRAKNIAGFADMVVKDFKDYDFNTIPFHAYSVPYRLYEERKIYYVAKLKIQDISVQYMNRKKGDRFPDIFTDDFRSRLDGLAKKVCAPLREAKYCLGYRYVDMPDLKPVRIYQRGMFPDKGLIYPWVRDLRALPATAPGKEAWMGILKKNHGSAAAAAGVYGLENVDSWKALGEVTDWPVKPRDTAQAKKDADDMLAAIAERWYGLHHKLIKKYDPNHLILGDKHDVGYDTWVGMIPDRILGIIGEYCDVLMIQYYSFYTDLHNQTLKALHEKSGLPILNGDHAYSCPSPKQTKVKGLNVGSQKAVAEEYRRYLKRSLEDHPYMLGWWYCGYIEQWNPAGTAYGQQCGFFSPFGKPNEELLGVVKEANRKAVEWHRGKESGDE